MKKQTKVTAAGENLVDKKFTQWSSSEVAAYMQSKEQIGNYAELFQKHKIDGSIAHRLSHADLKEMGIVAVGDRHRVMSALEGLRRAKEQKDRETVLWQGEEVMYWSCGHKCAKTCCGCCSEDKTYYTLRANFLEMRRPDINKCGAIKCCFGHSYKIDTVDLSNVRSVELEGIPPPCLQQCCCCAKSQEHVRVNLSEPKNSYEVLRLCKGDGQGVSRKIKNQVEIMQVMERS